MRISLYAVAWLRRLLPRKPGFAPGSAHVGFVVDKAALGQVIIIIIRIDFKCISDRSDVDLTYFMLQFFFT
jgi:hypothetical protein